MITIEQLAGELARQIVMGNGQLPIAYGDCNTMHLVSGFTTGVVEDIEEYFLEEKATEDIEEGTPPNVFIVGE